IMQQLLIDDNLPSLSVFHPVQLLELFFQQLVLVRQRLQAVRQLLFLLPEYFLLNLVGDGRTEQQGELVEYPMDLFCKLFSWVRRHEDDINQKSRDDADDAEQETVKGELPITGCFHY